ncbi:putative acetyltransferase [Bacilli bacterium PM5-3]|nr:putative acetyltransferase [Bacilli bacterium PM5-3]
MRKIKELEAKDFDNYIDIAYKAYPSFKDYSKEGIEDFKRLSKIRISDEKSKFFALYEDEKLLSAMRLIDFDMNFFGTMIKASGLASLGVHLLHKKEKIAKTMVEFYENYYKERNIPIATLLPFATDFYKKMGYGFGPKMNRYRIKASNVPACFEKADLRYIERDNLDELFDRHNQYVRQIHGMFEKISDEIDDLLNNNQNIIIGNYENNMLTGYLVFEFENAKDDNYTINNMIVKELVYDNALTLRKLLGFIKKQEDQVNIVVFDTQNEGFVHIFDNPLNDTSNYIPYGNLETNTQAIGVMYKILDIKQAFELYNYRNYNNVNLKTKIIIVDEYKHENEIYVEFVNGKATTTNTTSDITMKIGIADFSSLFLGCISINDLYRLGLIELDNTNYLSQLNLAYMVEAKPECNTDF